ncbi:hypothetical protein GGS21DRAFT_100166 [Xylaria nigripes]|nr:hypothetical protein GGS21DRAFT_100166 [Xylaria nigripes]
MWWRPARCRGSLRPLLNQKYVKNPACIISEATAAAALRPFSSGTLKYPEAPSKDQHGDVASYIAYAERTGLDVESKVFIGTHYEYSIASALRLLGFDLRRVGGQSDKGIDLLGTWHVPSAPKHFPLRVLLQCKAYSTSKTARIGPQYIRELEGAYLGAPPGWRGSGVIGLLVTQRPATKGVREALANSRWPLAYLSCSKDGVLEQMLWNQRAEEEGLEGMGVTVKMSNTECSDATQRLVLTWKGRPYKFPVTTAPSPASEKTGLAQEAEANTKPVT